MEAHTTAYMGPVAATQCTTLLRRPLHRSGSWIRQEKSVRDHYTTRPSGRQEVPWLVIAIFGNNLGGNSRWRQQEIPPRVTGALAAKNPYRHNFQDFSWLNGQN